MELEQTKPLENFDRKSILRGTIVCLSIVNILFWLVVPGFIGWLHLCAGGYLAIGTILFWNDIDYFVEF